VPEPQPIIVNDIAYANQEELNQRIKADAEALAHFLYDLYKQRKNQPTTEHSPDQDNVRQVI
jgi:hypothetical protein